MFFTLSYTQNQLESTVKEFSLDSDAEFQKQLNLARKNSDSLMKIWNNEGNSVSIRCEAMELVSWEFLELKPDTALIFADLLYSFADKENNDKWKAKALNDKGAILLYQGEFDSAFDFFESSYHLSKKCGNKELMIYTLKNMGEVKAMYGDFAEASSFYQKCLLLTEAAGSKERLAIVHNDIGLFYQKWGNIDSALFHLNKSKKIGELTGKEVHIAKALLNIGLVYMSQGNSKKALNNFIQSMEISKRTKNINLMMVNSQNIGLIYQQNGEYIQALKSFQDYLKFCTEIGDRRSKPIALLNIGLVYFSLNKFEKSREYFELCTVFCIELKQEDILGQAYVNLGAICLNQKKFSDGLVYLRKSESLAKKTGNLMTLSKCYLSMGTIYSTQKKYGEGLKYLKLTRKIQTQLNSYDPKAVASLMICMIYKKQGKEKEALKMLELYIEESDTIRVRNSRNDLLRYDLETKYALDSVRHENELLIQMAKNTASEETVKRKNSELKVKKNQQLMLFGGLGLLALFTLFILNRFRVSARQNKIIEKQKDKNLYLSQKILEQDQQLILGETAKTVAHELNSPLGAIKAGAEGLHYLMEELINNLLPASSKEDLDLASHLSSQQETGTFVGMKQKQEKARDIQKKMNEKFGLESASSSEIASELSELHVFDPDEKIINFLVSCQDRQPIYKLAKCIGQIKMISETTISATNKSADVVSSVREALDFQSSEDFEDVRLDESISSVVTIIESNINEKGIFKQEIDPEIHLRSVNEFKIFQLWYNLIVFLVEEAADSMEIKVSASENEPSTQVRFSLNQAIQNKTLNEHHYKIIMDAKRDSNDLRMGIVKYLLSENNIELQSEISSDQTVFTIDFPAKKA